jgi:hypothetical protein
MASLRPCTRPGDADLVHHLRQLSGAAGAQQREGARKGHGHRPRRLESRGIAATHHGQRAVLGARLAARNGRIDKVQADVLRGGVQLAGHVGRGGGVVHEDRARRHAGEGSIGPQRDRPQVVVVADATEHDVGALGRLARRFSMLWPASQREFVTPCYCF